MKNRKPKTKKAKLERERIASRGQSDISFFWGELSVCVSCSEQLVRFATVYSSDIKGKYKSVEETDFTGASFCNVEQQKDYMQNASYSPSFYFFLIEFSNIFCKILTCMNSWRVEKIKKKQLCLNTKTRMQTTTIPKIMVQPPSPEETAARKIITDLRHSNNDVKKRNEVKYVHMAILKQDNNEVRQLGNYHCHLVATEHALLLDEAAKMIFTDNGGFFVDHESFDYFRDDMGSTDRLLFFSIWRGDVAGGFNIQSDSIRIFTQDQDLKYNLWGLDTLVQHELGVPISLPNVGGTRRRRRRTLSGPNSLETRGWEFQAGDSWAGSCSSSRTSSAIVKPATTVTTTTIMPTSHACRDPPLIDPYLSSHRGLLRRSRSSVCLRPELKTHTSLYNKLNPTGNGRAQRILSQETSI